jgi:uncharacterized protein
LSDQLTDDEKKILLLLARESLELAVNRDAPLKLSLGDYSLRLRENGASFVTLTKMGELRGCIGALEPYQPLVQDVCEHAAAAALEDYRFPPVHPNEVPYIHIELSRLTFPQPLIYHKPEELAKLLNPHVDGVILRDGGRRATFLPQVWDKLPDPAEFLSHLCMKMNAPLDLWTHKVLQVAIYQVEEFEESGN